ncbi:hypothetical protein PIB30_030127 [Stylosanthes scabra]|uniref:Replication protein A 70 kDa DNA-binding subunit B/D first OB fold domain-containing protein n=1 Tax=Stylosanthes scabra TaxID=79078 RepID=A0ABU6YAA4_9FABA|nr:hypothetical protein [Stylosanthes scabra]
MAVLKWRKHPGRSKLYFSSKSNMDRWMWVHTDRLAFYPVIIAHANWVRLLIPLLPISNSKCDISTHAFFFFKYGVRVLGVIKFFISKLLFVYTSTPCQISMAIATRAGQPSNGTDRVADIKATKLAWNVVVGVARMYQLSCHNDPSDYYSMELILQDKEICFVVLSAFGGLAGFGALFVSSEFGVYNMKGFIVQTLGRGVRSTPHKFKLSFYLKTCVRLLSDDAFPFSPFHITPFSGVVAMTQAGQCHLIDCIGQVVGKEEIIDMVTRTGEASKRMSVHLEDLEGNTIKCTLFGAEMIGQFNEFLLRSNLDHVVMIAQLFKPNYYLNETSI